MGKASKDRRDIFYRLAKEQGWRARSAFKLLQADETFNLLDGVTRAVDLCAAPGGWSQVLSKKMYEPKSPEEREKVKIIAVDMQGMAPIDGVTELRADITKESTATAIIDFFGGQKAELVICDGAPDVTGMHDWDAYMQAQLLLSALSISTYILEEGGSFMGKVYRAANTSKVYRQLKRFFKDCCVFKPSASRNSSIEAFVVCRQFCMPENHVPCNLITEWHGIPGAALKNITGKEPDPVEHLPFVAHQCEYDADRTYEFDDSYVYHEAVQKPLTAAYQEVVEKAKTVNFRYDGYKESHENDPPPVCETEIKYDANGKEIYFMPETEAEDMVDCDGIWEDEPKDRPCRQCAEEEAAAAKKAQEDEASVPTPEESEDDEAYETTPKETEEDEASGSIDNETVEDLASLFSTSKITEEDKTSDPTPSQSTAVVKIDNKNSRLKCGRIIASTEIFP